MQLLRLEMKGFKSFADKTTIHFSPGMTAVVGPNGSGKSNITDAVRWVLGESNVRQLRGHKAEDIIFSGTEQRRPMSAAEVTLVFDNTDETLAEGLVEVSVTRRMYRTGESDFFINKRSVRLKDIHRLFADTGLGRDSMAIIGQNRVDAILNSRPEERRLIFEEVAGIAKFKMNKEEAQRKIQATERNMERVSDIIAGVEEQLGPAEEKAAATRQYQAWAQEKRVYDGVIGFHDFKTADRLYTKVENEHIALTQEEISLETEMAQLDAQSVTAQEKIDRWEQSREQEEERLQQAQQTVERAKGALALVEEKIRSKQEEYQRLQSQREDIMAMMQADQQQVQLWRALLVTEQADIESCQAEVAKAQDAYDRAMQALQEQQIICTALQQEVSAQHRAELERMRQRENWAAEERRLTTLLTECEQQLETLQQELAAVQTQYDRLCLQVSEAQAQEVHAEQEKIEASAHLQQQERILQEGEREEQILRRQCQEREGRCQILQQWAQDYEGYGQGTKKILQAKAPWRTGVLGAVGDLFTVEDPYTTAIEVAIGGAVHHVVTTTAAIAASGVQYLKDTKGGRITFLPQDTVRGRRLQSPALEEDGVIGLAVDCISFDPAYEGIFLQLLGRMILVETMEQAIRLQKKYKQQLYVVTLGGEQLRPGGSLTGGTVARKQASVLVRKEELRQCEAELAKLQAALEERVAMRQAAEASIHGDRDRLATANQAWQEAHMLALSLTAKQENLKERLQRKQDEYQQWQEKQGGAKTQLATMEVERAALTDTPQADSDSMQRQQAAFQLLQEKQQAQVVAQEALTAAKLSLSEREQQRAMKEQQCQDKESQMEQSQAKLGPLEEMMARLQAEINTQLPAEVTRWQDTLRDTKDEVASLESVRRAGLERLKNERQQVQTLIQQRQECEKRYALVQHKLGDIKGRMSEYQYKGEQALAFLESIGYTRQDAQRLQVPGGVADWKSQRAHLEAQMESLGPINPQAIEEWEQLQERYQFLQNQQEDMESAKHQLELVIDELNTAMAAQLQDVLGIVGQRFQEVFAQLFGGGTAQIVLTDSDHILTGGIDFYIQPPGKKRQQLSLLSGGERALTVIALLFSFLNYRPAPFCILDEVDAALDEANVERFSRYLHTLGTDTQFIVVSHRKKTMEAAQVLQGVTMVEQGVSRILTVNFDDYEEDL